MSAVLNCKQAKVAVALLEHEVVCLPNLFWGGMEGEPGICEARCCEFSLGADRVAVYLSLGGLEMGGDGGAPGGVGGRHFCCVNEASRYRFVDLLECDQGHGSGAAV